MSDRPLAHSAAAKCEQPAAKMPAAKTEPAAKKPAAKKETLKAAAGSQRAEAPQKSSSFPQDEQRAGCWIA